MTNSWNAIVSYLQLVLILILHGYVGSLNLRMIGLSVHLRCLSLESLLVLLLLVCWGITCE